MKKDKKKNSKIGTAILIIIVIALAVFGIFAIRYNFSKMDKAKSISEKIIDIYFNSKQ